MALNRLVILLDLLLVVVMAAYAIIVYEKHQLLSYLMVIPILLLMLIRAYQSYRRWDMKLKARTALYNAIAIVDTGDFSPLPRIMDLCACQWLSEEDYKAGMEILERTTKSEPEKAMAAFSKVLDDITKMATTNLIFKR